jgi:hypothetical protein
MTMTEKITAYLTARSWRSRSPGDAGTLWDGPDGWTVAVLHHYDLGNPDDYVSFTHVIGTLAVVEGRPSPVIAAEIFDPAEGTPRHQTVPAWTWTRLAGTGAEILTDHPAQVCIRPARQISGQS